MTEAEWCSTDDAALMLEALWQLPQSDEANLERRLHRFYLACCRVIWRLLPQEASRRGVEMGEQYLAGKVNREELSKANWDVEGAAFVIDYNTDPQAIQHWADEVRAIPRDELQAILNPRGVAFDVDARELLKRAAYFADYAMIYPHLTPKGSPPENYALFLSADLLREFVGNPFRSGKVGAA